MPAKLSFINFKTCSKTENQQMTIPSLCCFNYQPYLFRSQVAKKRSFKKVAFDLRRRLDSDARRRVASD